MGQKNRCKTARRASAYALVLLTTMLVTIIGVAALTATRIHARSASELESSVAARLTARSGLDLAMRLVREDPSWRTRIVSGQLSDWAQLGRSDFRIDAVDPVDGLPANNYTDPIVLTATGRCDSAIHKMQATMEATRGSSLLEAALHAQGSLTVNTAILNADQVVSSNADVIAQAGATVTAKVYAAGAVSGATYTAGTSAGQPARPSIDANAILNTYWNMATVISINQIPAGNREKIINAGFESGATGWAVYGGASGAIDSSKPRTGSWAGRVYSRSANTDGAYQDVTAVMRNGQVFTASMWMRRQDSWDVDGRFQLELTYRATPESVPQVTTVSTTPVSTSGGGYRQISALITPTWTGVLDSAKLIINSGSSLASFYVDDVSLTRTALGSFPYIEGVVLSPANNPYGATNANGIYAIDCNGEDLHIRDCRIFGTLVLKNAGSGTVVEKSVSWRAAVKNYPILIVTGPVEITLNTAALSESSINANFNPAGSPAADELLGEDADLYDSYPSKLTGLIMIGGNVRLGGTNTFRGVMLSSGTINVSGVRSDIAFDARYLNTPPPGFDSVTRSVTLKPGTFRPVVQ